MGYLVATKSEGVSSWFSKKLQNTKERFSNLFSGGPFSTNAQIDEYGEGFAAAKAQGPAALAEYIRHHPAPGLAAVETVATMGASTLERGAIQQAEKMIALSKGESVAVLGHFPVYTKLAKELNAEVFDVGSKWLTMNTAQRWAANKAFLDSGIERGIPFILATEIRPGMNYFRAEVQYLMKNGYEYGTVGGMKALVKVP